MSRLSSAYINALRQPVIYLAHFAEFDFRGGVVRLWTGSGSISWDSKTWLGAGTFASISAIEETAEVEAPSFSFGLLGIDSTVLAAAGGEQYRGRDCQLWQAVMTSDFASVVASVRLFGGTMSHMLIQDSGSSGSITLFAENELVRLNQPNEVRYTDEHQQAIFPGDRGLRFIANTADASVYWGRFQQLGSKGIAIEDVRRGTGQAITSTLIP
jgi:hypothetical protein